MDQVGESETIEEVLSELNTFLNEFGQSCYVVLTGRPLIINAHVDSLWKNEDWTLAHIEDLIFTNNIGICEDRRKQNSGHFSDP